MKRTIRRATSMGCHVAIAMAIAGCQIEPAGVPCGDGLCLPGRICVQPSNSELFGTQSICVVPGQCGNSYIDPGEECDDGDKNDDRGHCHIDCVLNHCGNGQLERTEECDEGASNRDDRDCRSDCGINRCGDGFVNASGEHHEECDGGHLDGFVPVPTESADCNLGCTKPTCGDGIVNRAAGEECDNGTIHGVNQNQDTATCTFACKIAVCGDHLVLAGLEDCDEGGVDTASCNADCTTWVCGDGYVNQAAGEQCDDGPDNGTANSNCDSFCQINHCGNGIIDVSVDEQCDPGGGPNPVDTEECTHTCHISRCGDGYTNKAAHEECDDGATNGDACDYGNPNCERCNSTCTAKIHPGGPFCGDGIVQKAFEEVCEPSRGPDQDAQDCDSDCTPVVCGDGHHNEVAESCDDGNQDVCGTCPATDCKNKPAVTAAQASARIKTSDAATIADGSTFRLDDGFGKVVTFEFTLSAPQDGTHVPIHFITSPDPTGAVDIASSMVDAINHGAPAGFLITASVPMGGTTVTVTNTRETVLGNTPIVVSGLPNFGFAPVINGVFRMDGGAAGNCDSGIRCASNGDCKSGVCNTNATPHMCQ